MKRKILISIGVFFTTVLIFRPAGAAVYATKRNVDELKAKIARIPDGQGDHTKAVLYTELGMLHYREGRAAEAAQAFEKALEGDTTHTMRRTIFLYIGKSYESSGRIDKAIGAYEQAVGTDPKNWKRHRDLAGLYETAKLYDKAVLSYQKAMRLNPREGSIFLSLGRTRRKQGLYQEAAVELSKAIEMGADSKEACRELSLAYEGQSKFESAAAACSRGMVDPVPASDWARLVYLSVLAGDKEIAKRGIAKLKSLPESGETLAFYESLVSLMQEQPKQILSMNASSPELQKLLLSMELKENK